MLTKVREARRRAFQNARRSCSVLWPRKSFERLPTIRRIRSGRAHLCVAVAHARPRERNVMRIFTPKRQRSVGRASAAATERPLVGRASAAATSKILCGKVQRPGRVTGPAAFPKVPLPARDLNPLLAGGCRPGLRQASLARRACARRLGVPLPFVIVLDQSPKTSSRTPQGAGPHEAVPCHHPSTEPAKRQVLTRAF
jgi:hypothetical protein